MSYDGQSVLGEIAIVLLLMIGFYLGVWFSSSGGLGEFDLVLWLLLLLCVR